MPARGDAPDRLVIGTRGSPLALTQSGMIRDALAACNPGVAVEIEIIKTTGDRQQEWTAPPSGPQAGGGKGIFVKEIEDAMLEGRVDLAVHSMKDLPAEIPEGLRIAAVPRREDPRDVLVARGGTSLMDLAAGARVGTGSPRRVSQIRNVRRDLVFLPIRGNVDTRLRKVREGTLDAVVLAAAGLRRLGLLDPAWPLLPEEVCLPAVGQGALAIEAREGDARVLSALEPLHDAATAACVAAERAFLAALGGGCQIPVAALATIVAGGDAVALRGAVCDPEGVRLIRVAATGPWSDAGSAGREAAEEAIRRGASEILSSFGRASGG
jgi:hydroxymethylbilane synthase